MSDTKPSVIQRRVKGKNAVLGLFHALVLVVSLVLHPPVETGTGRTLP